MKYYDPEIEALSGLYDLLSAVVEGFPDKEFNQYSKKQKQRMISNLITFSNENGPLLSQESNEMVYPYPELAFARLRDELRSAKNRHAALMTARREEWLAFAQCFDSLTKDALIRMIDQRLGCDVFLSINSSKTASFSPESTSAYRQTLHLENPVFSGNFNPDSPELLDAEIDQLDQTYRLSFVQDNARITVNFSDLRLETQLMNYSASNTADGAPWSQISDALNALGHKQAVLGMRFLNDKEIALWPLCAFRPLHNLFTLPIMDGDENKAVELFLGFAERVGNSQIAAVTRKYANSQLKAKDKAHQALVKALRKPESEALIRIILQEIRAAAAAYASEVELDAAPEVLGKTRARVTALLKQQGFVDKYPHFRKMSSFHGLRLLEIQGQPVLAFNEKNMACLIDCYEQCIIQNTIILSFTASTVFLKKDELSLFGTLDGYSGFFHHKRRRARRLTANFDFRDDGSLVFDLEGITIAAAKTAACEKLTKEERKKIMSVGPGLYGCLYYGGFFLLAGLLFGLLFCPAMFLLALILGAGITLVSSEAPTFLEYFKTLLFDFPWWQMFLFCIVGFGLPMTLLTAFAKKRG